MNGKIRIAGNVMLLLVGLLTNPCVVLCFSNNVQGRPQISSFLTPTTSSNRHDDSAPITASSLRLYNPNSSPLAAESLLLGRRRRRSDRSSRLFAIPEIERWRIVSGGSVQGYVKNHPTIPDGDIVTTSPLKAPNAVGSRMVVTTSSGTKYKLLEPLKPETKAGTVTVNKGFFSFNNNNNNRQSPSIKIGGFGSGANLPVLDDWKLLDNDSIQGYVFNHPSIPDGQIISTSTLSNPGAAAQKAVVTTFTGSKYRLGEPEGSSSSAPETAAAASAATKAPSRSVTSGGGGPFSFLGLSSSPAAPAKKASSPPSASAASQQQSAVAAASVSSSTRLSNADKEKDLRQKRAQATRDYGLTGERLGVNGEYLLAGQPIKSTSAKSLIYRAYMGDADGLPIGDVEKDSILVKISRFDESIEREAGNYRAIQKGVTRGRFVNLIDFLPSEKMNSNTGRSNTQCALVMERGAEDLKTYLAKKRVEGGLSGKELRDAAVAAAQCIQAAHLSGLVWTDMKTENFVVTFSGEFKGIDLESAMPIGGNPVDYSPEACPPEFAKAFLSGDGPYFTLEPNYDIWSFGMMCYEMATGAGYFDGKTPIQITRALSEMEEFLVENSADLDGRMKSLIETCLQVDPKKRPSAAQVLLHPYFLTTGIGPFSF